MLMRMTRRNKKVRISHCDKAIVITIYFVLKPFYFFKSGLPQISDFFLIFAAAFFLLQKRFRIVMPSFVKSWILLLSAICSYQLLIDFIWYGVTSNSDMLMKALQYIFNLIAAIVCVFLTYEEGVEKLRKAVCNGCFLSVLITGGSLMMGIGRGYRSTGFFNNPNQLGYFAMITLTVVALFPKELPKWKTLLIILISLWASFLSLSKASILAVLGLGITYLCFVCKTKNLKSLLLRVFIMISMAVVVYLFLYGDVTLLGKNETLLLLRNRILHMSTEQDSNLATGRGYARIFEMDIHFLWGMGEGAFDRFSTLSGLEVHSTYVNLLVSYGLIGFCGYVFLMIRVLKSGEKTIIKNLACFSGLLLYFFTHNGIRNTLLWILLTTVLVTQQTDYLQNKYLTNERNF